MDHIGYDFGVDVGFVLNDVHCIVRGWLKSLNRKLLEFKAHGVALGLVEVLVPRCHKDCGQRGGDVAGDGVWGRAVCTDLLSKGGVVEDDAIGVVDGGSWGCDVGKSRLVLLVVSCNDAVVRFEVGRGKEGRAKGLDGMAGGFIGWMRVAGGVLGDKKRFAGDAQRFRR